MPAFGWIPSVDPRDRLFPMAAHVDLSATLPPYKFWPCRQALDQGPVGACVGTACRGWLEAQPRPVLIGQSWTWREIYDWAQINDGIPGQEPEMSGTTLRAGMKALVEAGEVESYVWGFDLTVAKTFLLQRGPIILASYWYQDMMNPDAANVIHASGPRVGAHAYLVQGYSQVRGQYRILQSWGRGWGVNGRCWIGEADLIRLFGEGGEAVTAIEIGGLP